MKTEFREIIADSMDDSKFWNIHDSLKGLDLEKLKQVQDSQTLPFVVCILNLTGDLNTGMIIRTACIFGAKEIIIYGRRKYDKRSTVGSQNYVTITRIDGFNENDTSFDIDKFYKVMEEKNLLPIFVEQHGWPIEAMNWKGYASNLLKTGRTPCLVLGNESTGIPKEMLKDSSHVISISQRGVLRSLNVSSAASIAIHQLSSSIESVLVDKD